MSLASICKCFICPFTGRPVLPVFPGITRPDMYLVRSADSGAVAAADVSNPERDINTIANFEPDELLDACSCGIQDSFTHERESYYAELRRKCDWLSEADRIRVDRYVNALYEAMCDSLYETETETETCESEPGTCDTELASEPKTSPESGRFFDCGALFSTDCDACAFRDLCDSPIPADEVLQIETKNPVA